MKNKLLIVIASLLSLISQAQLTGTKTIPGDYATIAAAVSALNVSGVGTGGVIYNVQEGYTEEITEPILITATGTAGNPIVFQAAASSRSPFASNPVVRRTDAGSLVTTTLEAQGDGVIIIQGGDYITFDRIDVQSNNHGIEYGYFLRKASGTDGCKNITIMNCSITMTKGTSGFVIGIYSSNLDADSPVNNAAGITVTSTGGRSENILLTGNTISNVFAGIAIRGFNHAVAPYDFMDQNNTIGTENNGNTIQNFGGNSATTTFGVHLHYQTSPNVSYNIIDNIAGDGSDATGFIYGIWHQLSNNVGNFVSSNNSFTFGENSATGGVTGIQATPAGQPSNSIVIQNNTFRFGTFNCTGTSSLINCTGAKANTITVTGNTTIGSINKTNTTGSFYGYQNLGSGVSTGGVQTISNNNFSNITLSGTGIFYGIECRSNTNQLQAVIITSNVISNVTAGGQLKGINQSAGATGSTVNNNIISGLINTGASTGAVNNTVTGLMLGSNGTPVSITCYNNTITDLRGAEPVYGIWNQQGNDNKIYNNTISNLTTNTASIGPLYGIIINGGVQTNIYNNYITDLKAPSATGDYPIIGVYIAGGTTVNMYYNTIYLNASSTGTTFGTAGVYAKTSGISFEMRNNIIVNTSNHAGNTGFTVAYRRFDNYLGSYSNASDNNDFYVSSNSGTGNYLYCEGSSTTPVTAKDSTLADYQARVAPRDAVSFSEMPPFVHIGSTPYDLHLKTNVATLCESGGQSITTPAINVDFDNEARYPDSGYPNNDNPAYAATHPDVGADEFGGIRAFVPLSVPLGTVTEASCQSESDGAIDIMVVGGVPPYTYTWSNGATTQDIDSLAPGTYNLSVTDFQSAHISGSWTVGFGSVCNNTTVSGTVVSSGCYNARQTITVAGLTVSAPGGHVELIAGENIIIQPGTVVESGAWFFAHISTTYCPASDAPMTATTTDTEIVTGIVAREFSLYPNPVSGNFTLEVRGSQTPGQVAVEIFNMSGNRVMTSTMSGEMSRVFNIASLPAGVYFVRIVAEGAVETIRVVKTE